MDRLRYTIKTYSKNIKELGELAGIDVHADPVRLENDDVQLSQAGLHVRFKFDGKDQIGMNDGEASGGQQVMKSLVLLIGLLKSEDGSGGFVFIDEPFAHLDIRNIQLVGEFLKNTEAQYLMTTPLDAQHGRLRSVGADAHHQQEEERHAVGAADFCAAEKSRGVVLAGDRLSYPRFDGHPNSGQYVPGGCT